MPGAGSTRPPSPPFCAEGRQRGCVADHALQAQIEAGRARVIDPRVMCTALSSVDIGVLYKAAKTAAAKKKRAIQPAVNESDA